MEKRVSRREALAAGGWAAALAASPLPRASAASAQKVTIYIFAGMSGTILGPDRKGHDAFVPANFVVKAGVPVAIDFISYDDDPHTLTAPKLGLNIQIQAGEKSGKIVKPATTSATFTIVRPGTYRRYCALACDTDAHGWAMEQGFSEPSKEGYMAGFIVAM